MGWRPAVAVASTVGSVAGLFTPFTVVTFTRLLTGRADGVFEWGLMFGGPMAGAVGGAVLGARAGRRLPAGASAARTARAAGWAGALGAAWSAVATSGLGAVAWLLVSDRL